MKVTRVNFTFYRMADELIPKWLNNTFDNISDIATNTLPPLEHVIWNRAFLSWIIYWEWHFNHWCCTRTQSCTLRHFIARSVDTPSSLHLIHMFQFDLNGLLWPPLTKNRSSLKSHSWRSYLYHISYLLSIFTGLKKCKFIFLPDSKSLINK